MAFLRDPGGNVLALMAEVQTEYDRELEAAVERNSYVESVGTAWPCRRARSEPRPHARGRRR